MVTHTTTECSKLRMWFCRMTLRLHQCRLCHNGWKVMAGYEWGSCRADKRLGWTEIMRWTHETEKDVIKKTRRNLSRTRLKWTSSACYWNTDRRRKEVSYWCVIQWPYNAGGFMWTNHLKIHYYCVKMICMYNCMWQSCQKLCGWHITWCSRWYRITDVISFADVTAFLHH